MQYLRENTEKIIAGRKTQTRRIENDGDYAVLNAAGEIVEVRNRKGRLKYKVGQDYAVQPGRGQGAMWWTETRLDGARLMDDKQHDGWTEARQRITRIRRERLGDISEADAIAEGFLQLLTDMGIEFDFSELPVDDIEGSRENWA